ncbi:MAG: DUF6019 family protein [Clostridia bacterium]|nr:DUF6019 family protein [Clostridia bacterium]
MTTGQIGAGTVLIVLIALYFVVKWAVKNGIKEAYREIKEPCGDGTPELPEKADNL